jgi:hypothetical protein
MGYLLQFGAEGNDKIPDIGEDPPPASPSGELSAPIQPPLEVTFAESAPDRVERLVEALVLGMRLRCLSAE